MRANNRKWEKAFEQTFKISAEEFYERLSKYKRKDYKKLIQSIKTKKALDAQLEKEITQALDDLKKEFTKEKKA